MANLFSNQHFEVEHQGLKIKVVEHNVQDQQVYRLIFSDQRAPLVITQLSTWEGEKWTSVPQGRQNEAELYGKVIRDYLEQERR